MEKLCYKVLDKGYIELLDMMGNDLSPVEAARVSFNKDVYDNEARNDKLLEYLYENNHLATTEHIVLKLRVKAPIIVFRQWMRHRIGFSYNERSGRYSEFTEEDFYIPAKARIQSTDNKQGSIEVDDVKYDALLDDIYAFSLQAYDLYEHLLNAGLAKELARLVLPVNYYSEMIVTVNLRALMNFLVLRLDSHAQYEIREYANTLLQIFEKVLPKNYNCFVKYILKKT
jgi:thymidylate synthase (FAD)